MIKLRRFNRLQGHTDVHKYGGLRKMEAYKQEFIEFMVDSDVLKFGEFTLKSGRKSPFFYECRRICNRFSAEKAG